MLAAFPDLTHAAISDSADFVHKDDHAATVAGDIVLNNPSGEGLETRYKWGAEDHLNIQGILGIGSDTRRFKLGAQANYNFLPDIGGQPGVSAIGGAMLLKRKLDGKKKTGLRFTIGPMIHKEFEGLNGLPLLLYTAIPWSLTLQSGSYVASSELAFGAITDITRDHSWYVTSEGGITLSKGESYILLGVGMRFTPYEKGPRAPTRPQRKGETRREKRVQPSGRDQNNEQEFRTEDFQ